MANLQNFHYVLWFNDERTILIKHESFSCHMPDVGNPKWLYLSSLGEHAKDLHFEIADYLAKHPETKLAFSLRHFKSRWAKSCLLRFTKKQISFVLI